MEMDGLRWLLLVSGLIVIACVYLYSRLQRSKDSDSPQQDLFAARHEPVLKRAESQKSDRMEPSIELDSPEPAELPSAQKIVTLRIVARDSTSFAGDELVLSLRGIGMRHGKFGIFHSHDGAESDQVVFSAASLIEPGSFDLAKIKEQKIPGISLFLVLPGPVDGATAFDAMMAAARTLSRSLNADLLDESGSTLSIQRERYLREEIIQFEHSRSVI